MELNQLQARALATDISRGEIDLGLRGYILQFVVSVASVLVFAGLTAYDTQRIKKLYANTDEDQVTSRKAIMGALTLYLDFINLFHLPAALLGEPQIGGKIRMGEVGL